MLSNRSEEDLRFQDEACAGDVMGRDGDDADAEAITATLLAQPQFWSSDVELQMKRWRRQHRPNFGRGLAHSH